tara:strand:+ start:2327 stop:2731 length:405 start_codon:yes stop_codon:yes gene_type:complete
MKTNNSEIVDNDETNINNEIAKLEKEFNSFTPKLIELARDLHSKHTFPSDQYMVIENQYYSMLKKSQKTKKQINLLIHKISELKKNTSPLKNESEIAFERKRKIKEITVTSSTYERAQKRLFKNVDGFLCGKRF